MPVFFEEPEVESPARPRLSVRPSVVVEIDWALSGAHRPGRSRHPVLERFYDRQPGLADEVTSLWGPEERLSYVGYLELSAMAQPAGLSFGTDSDELLASLEKLCAAAPDHLPFRAEKGDDGERLRRRLRILRSSPAVRKRYVDVVRRVWTALRPEWEREGLPVVRSAVELNQAALDRGVPWPELLSNECTSDETLQEIVGSFGPAGEVVLVPAFFARKGLVIDLPDLLVAGIGVGDATAGRVRAEQLAHRLKAISDPTRLAILEALSRGEMTVTDIARRFGLAQPTVSNHIKLLREAGLVTTRNDGRSRKLALQADLLAEIVADLGELLGTPS